MNSPIFEWSDGHCYVKLRPGDIALVIDGVNLNDTCAGTKMIEAAYTQGFRDAERGRSVHEHSGPSTEEKANATQERIISKDNLDQH